MNNFKTVAFNTVGYNTADVQDIKLTGSQGYGTEFFYVWEGLPTADETVNFMCLGTEWDDSGFATDGYWYDMIEDVEANYQVQPNHGVVIFAAEGMKVEITPPYSL